METDEKDNKSNQDQNFDVSIRLEALEKTLEAINKNKKNTLISTYTGLIIIIVSLAIFITGWLSFFQNYDTNALVKEIELRIPDITECKEAQTIYSTIQGKLIPQYTQSLMKEFKAKSPLFAEDLQKEKENLADYLQTDVKNKLAENLSNELSKSEAAKLTEYFQEKIPPQKLNRISDILHNILQEKLTSEVNKQLSPAVNQINDINVSFEALYNNMVKEGEFNGVTPETIGEVENRFIEALLESVIYEINPQKGNSPVQQTDVLN